MSAVRTEESFHAEHAALPDDVEVAPGLTVGQLRASFARPASDPEGSRFVPSVAYSSAAADIGQMALYARRDPDERAPIVLFLHGGGWSSGHHYGAVRYLVPLAERGYVAATATYRFSSEAAWPASLEDAKCAVRWLRHHASEIGGDPDRIVVVGDSAGGHLAAMIAMTPGEYEGEGGWEGASSEILGAVLLYPPADLLSTATIVSQRGDDQILEYFGDDISAASPINRVHAGCPSILTLTGEDDDVTTAADIRRFHQRLDAAGVENRLEVFPRAGHSFDFYPKYQDRCLALMADFLVTLAGHP